MSNAEFPWPSAGTPITLGLRKLNVPAGPIIPFAEAGGTKRDTWPGDL